MLQGTERVISTMSVFAMNSEDPVSQKVMTPSEQRGGIYPNDFIGFTSDSWYGEEDVAIASLELPLHKDFKYDAIMNIGTIRGYADAQVRDTGGQIRGRYRVHHRYSG